jgi:hypothetical protein
METLEQIIDNLWLFVTAFAIGFLAGGILGRWALAKFKKLFT